ncbi:MAG: hypothetical protein JRI75_04710 [Deltaproteobacteria bacterium]|nr:hypothetical protein [Deltaproteobacteria bacterium]
MNPHQHTPSMNQKIFKIRLPVETISAYLICCSLSDANAPISTKNLLGMWNSTEAALIESLNDLDKRNILSRIISNTDGNNVYRLIDAEKWTLD